jgi:hypothetical protein
MLACARRSKSDLRPATAAPGEREAERLRRFVHNLRRESDFFYFFAHNPLKSPDSTK